MTQFTGNAYTASRAVIAKSFEGLNLTCFGTNLYFSVIYPGPVATAGLKRFVTHIFSKFLFDNFHNLEFTLIPLIFF